MVETESDDQEEDFEEAGEDMTLGAGQEDERQEGWEASVENSWTNILESGNYSLIPSSVLIKEPVRDMDRIVHTETDGDHEVVAGDGVYGNSPEVKEASDIHEGD